MKEVTIKFAEPKDEASIKNLLMEADLPYEDIANHLRHFILAKRGNNLIGVVGLEVYGEFGLLRSLAVVSAHRGKGIGKMLYENIMAYARLQGIKELYLLTTTAEAVFAKFGFNKVERNSVPKPILATKEFQSLCPSTAVCMVKRIEIDAAKRIHIENRE